MKNIFLCLLVFVFLYNAGCKTTKGPNAVTTAKRANEIKADNGMLNKEAADFMVKITDARMMGGKEGELAVQKGTTSEIRNYGKLMIKDQAILLTKIQKLANVKGIYLPATISNNKKDGYDDLNAKEGKNFDDKFIKMMRIDHERDIKDFKNAIQLSDKDIADFATEYLPLIQSHLDKLNAIKD